MAEPSGIDPADPKGAEPGGAPSAEQKAKRLEQEVADLKKQLEEAKGQVTTLTENLGKALTEDDVKTAVEAAKQEAEKARRQARRADEAAEGLRPPVPAAEHRHRVQRGHARRQRQEDDARRDHVHQGLQGAPRGDSGEPRPIRIGD